MNDSPGWNPPGPASSDPGLPEKGASEEPSTGPRGVEAGPPQEAAAGPQTAPEDAVPANWSQKQPPPQYGSWGTVPPPPQAPGAGWGGAGAPPAWGPPPGWGAAPPPAPEPGVIPLRPLSVGEVLQGAISMARIHWRAVLTVSLLLALVSQAATTVVSELMNSATESLRNSEATGQTPDPTALLRALGSLMGGLAVIGLVTTVMHTVATGLIGIVTSRSVLGRGLPAREAWAETRPHLGRLLVLALLLPLIEVGLSALGTVPGIVVAVAVSSSAGLVLAVLGWLIMLPIVLWIMIRLSLAAPALVLEKQGVFAALSRSMKLVRGAWWRVLGVQLLGGLIAALATFTISMPFSLLGAVAAGQAPLLIATSSVAQNWTYLIVAGIGSAIGTTLTLPLTSGVTSLLYVDQRIRREGLDLELARAAAN